MRKAMNYEKIEIEMVSPLQFWGAVVFVVLFCFVVVHCEMHYS